MMPTRCCLSASARCTCKCTYSVYRLETPESAMEDLELFRKEAKDSHAVFIHVQTHLSHHTQLWWSPSACPSAGAKGNLSAQENTNSTTKLWLRRNDVIMNRLCSNMYKLHVRTSAYSGYQAFSCPRFEPGYEATCIPCVKGGNRNWPF